MKAYKIITIFTIILLIVIISVASFVGAYKLIDYRVKNIIPKYKLGKEFSQSRKLELNVDDSVESTKIYDKEGNEVTEKEDGVEYTEENGYTTVETKVNDESILNEKNYEKSKKIIMNRMRKLGVDQYTILQSKENGTIYLDIPENDNTDEVIYYLMSRGVFKIIDSENEELLLDNSDIVSSDVIYGQVDNTNIVVYLQVEFNKEGTKKLEEISKKYIDS